jgi:hypothetical protein
MKLRISILAVCLFFTGVQLLRADAFRLYQIGNSHSFDSLPKNGLPELFELAGIPFVNGWHIRCAKPLSYIVQNPDSTCVDSNKFGTWLPALAEHQWDAVILQTHNGATGLAELRAIQTIVATQDRDTSTRLFIYVNWPRISGRSFDDAWNTDYTNGSQMVMQCHQYFTWLSQELDAGNSEGRSIGLIPIGHVLAELDQRFRRGEYPPFKRVDDLYRDDVHMNNVGKYVVGLTTLATLMDYDVRQFGRMPKSYMKPTANFVRIDLDLANYLQGIVWSVVNSKPL